MLHSLQAAKLGPSSGLSDLESLLCPHNAVPGLLPSCRHWPKARPQLLQGFPGDKPPAGFKQGPAPDSALRLVSLLPVAGQKLQASKVKIQYVFSLIGLTNDLLIQNLLYLLSYACPWDL